MELAPLPFSPKQKTTLSRYPTNSRSFVLGHLWKPFFPLFSQNWKICTLSHTSPATQGTLTRSPKQYQNCPFKIIDYKRTNDARFIPKLLPLPGRRAARYARSLLLLALLPPGNSLWAMEKLLIVHSALNMFTAPLWMAKEKGFFRKHGLDVETIYIP